MQRRNNGTIQQKGRRVGAGHLPKGTSRGQAPGRWRAVERGRYNAETTGSPPAFKSPFLIPPSPLSIPHPQLLILNS